MLYKGNKKFKTVHKGDELITRIYKGDELIYQDIEALYGFKFTIDTRLTASGTLNQNDATYTMARYQVYSAGSNIRPLKVKWGDGNEETVNLDANQTITHTYATAGEYQITISPLAIENNAPKPGWLTGIFCENSSNFWNVSGPGVKVKSIDRPFPAHSYIIDTNASSATRGFTEPNPKQSFGSMANLQSAPDDWLDGIDILNKVHASYFRKTFYSCGKNTNFNIFPIAKALIDRCDFSGTNMQEAFMMCFASVAAPSKRIPADLFENVTCENATNFSSMFQNAFNNAPTADYLPATLFSHIDTSKGTNFKQMFSSTFSSFGENSSSVTIPAGIFDFLDTHLATNVQEMFSNTFAHYGYDNTTLTIPAGLFDSLDLSSATAIGSGSTNGGMFYGTFQYCGYTSTVLTIPAGLFDFLDTATGLTEIREAFKSTFANCGVSSTVGTIPDGLFSKLRTQNVTRFDNVFNATFQHYAMKNSSFAIPAALFSSLDTSSGTSFSSMFYGTFSNKRCSSITLPATLFASINTANAKNVSNMFCSTFSNMTGNASSPTGTMTIPATLFSTLNTSGVTNFSQMFYSTFAQDKVTSIPNTLFSLIDASAGENFSGMFKSTFNSVFSVDGVFPTGMFSTISTSAGTTFSEMFKETFSSCTFTTIDLTNLFASLDTSNGTKLDYMFDQCFADFRGVTVTVPVGLFSGVDASNATTVAYMFNYLLYNSSITPPPQGLFGGLNIPSGATNNGLFASTFQSNLVSYYTLEDIFDGMTDFSWATAQNAASVFSAMFQKIGGQTYVGSASTILQHFNFVPASRTLMFNNQTNLSDYATIDNNWK